MIAESLVAFQDGYEWGEARSSSCDVVTAGMRVFYMLKKFTTEVAIKYI